jgi:hypothetical protein
LASGAFGNVSSERRASILLSALYDRLDGRSYLNNAKVGRKMNEVEFVLRRILKAGHEYAQQEYEERRHRPGVEKYYLNRYTAQVHLLQHLEKQFLERNTNDKQD